MVYIESKKLKKRKEEYDPYKFASSSPEPCLVDSKSSKSKDLNRVLTDTEKKDMFFLVSNISILNEHAMRLLAERSWEISFSKTPIKISRVPKDHPFFGFRWYNVRYVGSFGKKALSIFLIQEEDEQINPGQIDRIIIPGKMYIVGAIEYDHCKKCGTSGFTFKVHPNSKIIRCAACLGIQGVKRGL